MLRKYELQGMSLEKALYVIDKDIDNRGTTTYYWLSVPVSFDNVCSYVRFPNGGTLSIEFDNSPEHKITKVF